MSELNDAWTHDKSVFASKSVWKWRYAMSIHLHTLTGGTPSDPNVAKAWLTTRLGGEDARNQMLMSRLQQVITERMAASPKLTQEEVTDAALNELAQNVNGFKRTPEGHLFIEGRTLKAMIKEATSIGLGSGVVPARLGLTKKGAPGFVIEHVMVEEDTVVLTRDGVPISAPDEIQQSFVHTWRGSGIDHSEVLHDVDASFTLIADLDLEDLFPIIFSLSEQNGLGARRSQGSGKFVTTAFDRIDTGSKKK